ncbi:MAG TPA: type II secretion system protein [Candidatus Saccharimonadales bacterium]|nr:type II secretion system protein [Candidatus Saccharimonadales bacterium]
MKQLRLRKQMTGFTIIEVIIVLAIVGIIILALFIAVPSMQRNERNNRRKHTMELIGGALVEYYNTYGHYPTTSAEFDTFKNNTPELTKYYAIEFRDRNQSNNYFPAMDTIAVQQAHWCNKYGNGTAGEPVAGSNIDRNLYVVWTLIEPDNPSSHNTACIDNYDNSAP